MNPLNYMRLHDYSSRNSCQHWINASNGKIRLVDFIIDSYCDPSETLSVCVAVDAMKGVPDGSRTTEHGRGQVPMGVFGIAARRLRQRREVLSTRADHYPVPLGVGSDRNVCQPARRDAGGFVPRLQCPLWHHRHLQGLL